MGGNILAEEDEKVQRAVTKGEEERGSVCSPGAA